MGNGLLTANGMQGLTLPELAQKAHEMGGVVGAVVHAFNRWQWAEADFQINNAVERLPIDGLALFYARGGAGSKAVAAGNNTGAQPDSSMATSSTSSADSSQHRVASFDVGPDLTVSTRSKTSGQYQVINRSAVYYPPVQRNNAAVTYYSAMGTLAEVSVHRGTGQVEVLNHHSIIECGNLLSEELVSGQIQGGIAMGIGHALYEYLPLYEDGPGNGTWNFNRYHLPLAKEVAVWNQTAEILPPLSETDPPKGMAEVVMIPIVAAIVNGIAHATGRRFYSLPVTPEKIQEALA